MDAIDYAEAAGNLFALGFVIACGLGGIFAIAVAMGAMQDWSFDRQGRL